MTCVDCGGPGSDLGLARAGARLATCQSCGLVFSSNWSKGFQESLYDYYADRIDWTEAQLFPRLNAVRVGQLLGDVRSDVDGCHLLDVGCGSGGFVRAAMDLGWEAEGIDLSDSAIAICRRFGLNCSTKDFFEAQSRSIYDLIVMSELIEHVPGPVDFLRRACELLAPSGALYVTTPNFRSMDRVILREHWRVIGSEHFSYFTPRTFRACAARAGLEVQSIRTSNISLAAVRRLLGRGCPAADPEARADEEDFRESFEGSPLMRTAKVVTNGVLAATGSGNSLKAILRQA